MRFRLPGYDADVRVKRESSPISRAAIGVLALPVSYGGKRRRHALFACVTALSLCSMAVHAQDRADWRSLGQLKPGDRVAVLLKAHGTTVATFQSWSPDQIALDSLTIRKQDVQRVSRYRTGVWSRGKTALLGATIGGVAGLGVGLGLGGNCGHSLGPCPSRGALGAIFAGIAAAVGAGIGALLPHRRVDVIYAASR